MSPSAIVESNEMANQSAFSYAQAAKGQGTTPASNTAGSTETDAPVQDAQVPAADADTAAPVTDASTAAPATEQADTEAPENTEPREVVAPAPATPAAEKQDSESVPGSESDAHSESTQSRRADSRREDDAGRLDRPWRRNEKAPRSSSNATRSVDEQDSRKARRSKKGKTSEKQASEQATDKEQDVVPEPPKVELSEAPIPSVNIWHKRKEAHQAKSTKPTSTSTEATANGPSNHKEDKKTEESTPTSYTNGVKPQQKPATTVRPERNGPRGSRTNEKDSKSEIPPSVEDSAAWPTPETAVITIKEDSKKKTAEKIPEKSDRSDKDGQEDGNASKPRPKWLAVEYVPSVNFETQLPQMRGSKPRGGARGGRDGTSRAATNGAADKTTSATPVNKANDTRSRESANNGASQPPASKRGSVDVVNGQKKATVNTGSDKAKDSPAQTSETSHAPRDRPEGRGERGRGGYRGRGAHHAHSQSQHAVSSSGFHGQGAGSSRSQGYSPPLRQGGHGGMFSTPSQRGRGRNNATNFHRMSAPSGGSRVPVVPTQFAPYEYPMAAPIGTVPFAPVHFDALLTAAIKAQVDYYFSIENLCKDTYLRQRMDSQGFVPLHFVAAFKRLQDLTNDMNLLRAVCEDLTDVDYVIGEDNGERLRRRDGWQNFVYPMEERDQLARNDGPVNPTFKNRHYNYPNGQFNGIHPMHYGAPTYPHDSSFQHFAAHDVNGVATNGASQLSAAVPDFSPSGTVPLVGPQGETQMSSVEALTNGHTENAAPLTNSVHSGDSQATQS
ncbi:la family [Fusarium heterosporum]|uniref:La family n=1 Tax=Fusarium heterosporum TaxID=42747 RepID=A0A8H5SPF3_FUSHE|nr:la family [Fusarium heterosporum]